MKSYGYEVDTVDLEEHGTIKYARWLHPSDCYMNIQITKEGIVWLKSVIAPGSAVIDIGAYSGDMAIQFAAAAGAKGIVYAFEPNPAAFEVLKVNATLNQGIAPIIPFPFAATEYWGKYTFHYTDEDACNGGYMVALAAGIGCIGNTFPVDVIGVNVNSVIGCPTIPVSLIKIDTEGYDYFVLQSLRQLIYRDRPNILVEFYPGLTKDEKARQYDLLVELGYSIRGKDMDLLDKNIVLERTYPFDALCKTL